MSYFPDVARPSLYVDAVTHNHRSDRYGITLIFLLLVVSASWVANLGANWLQYLLLVATFVLCILRAPFSHFKKGSLFSFSLLFIGVGLVSAVRPGGANLGDIFFLSQIVIGFLAASIFGSDYRRAFGLFVLIMYYLCLSSLILFPFVFIFPGMIIAVPEMFQNFFEGTYNENRHFYTLFGITYFVSGDGVSGIWRNQSIFWEPGMFGVFSVLAFLMSDSIRVARKVKIVFFLSVISSFAPGAYAILSIYFGLRMARAANRGVIVATFIVLVFTCIAASTLPFLREIVLFLFQRDIYYDPSVIVRSTDLWLPYVVALDAPYFGFSTIEPYQDKTRIVANSAMLGITNSVGAYFYRYGYIFSAFLIFWIFRSFSRTGPAFGSMPTILLLCLMYQPIGFSSIFVFFIFLAVAARKKVRAAPPSQHTAQGIM